ncbi:TolC family protein [Oleiagrimonas soli]|uniref:Outer membrane protein TolC n=1 Tax=Oleiagrimonas soli TaxID=1543381 RepID=A0A841KT29_9GAMM|nr:TolC family protein [Oleiagrimonas soli]MBB6185108.1 outer membrane protein TolC [Oleiagrimonas soli]
MNRRMLYSMLLGAALAPMTVGSQPAVPAAEASPLPPASLALRAIERMPEVQAAAAELARAEADARLRAVGPHEFQLSVTPQRRRVEGGPTFNEWEAQVSRAVRWPRKARLDREIGASGVQAARLSLADAHHAGARRLLGLWSMWQRAEVVAQQQHAQVALWTRDRNAIARRVELGDAAQRDRVAADAALAQARAAALQADADAASARRMLESAFPDLPLPARVRLQAEPAALKGSDAQWSAWIVERSHEIGAAQARARMLEAESQRARADRMADPTVGVRVLNDLGGRERAVGLVLSVPIGVRQRGARAAAAEAGAWAAQAEVAMVQRDVVRDAREAVARARALQAVWRSRAQALRAADDSAAREERAYALGESGLAELLAARRVALEATLAERRAAVDAIEAVARVQVDAHELWHHHTGGSDPDEHEDAAVRLPDL